jgi:protein gp37
MHPQAGTKDRQKRYPYSGFVQTVATSKDTYETCWTGRVELIEKALEIPLHWRKPRSIFVCSMSDLFHEALPDEAIDRVFATIALCPQHTFMVLTKRPERMARWFKELTSERMVDGIWAAPTARGYSGGWPLPNVWLGVSVENQAAADERIPHLLRTPAVVRFVSVEPMLGPEDLQEWLDPLGQDSCNHCGDGERHYLNADERRELEYTQYGDARCPECGGMRDTTGYDPGIDWVICGAETGPGARPMDLEWVRSLRDQCQATGVPFFLKQLTERGRVLDGREWNEVPR